MARNEKREEKTIDYTEDKQRLLLEALLSSDEIFSRCQNILNAKYFMNKLRPAARFVLDYVNEYRVLPKVQQVNAETGLGLQEITGLLPQHIEGFLDEVEEFCKNRAIAEAVIAAVDLIEKGNYGEVEKQVREAILISLQSDIGTNYFANPRERLMQIKDNNGQVTTGWKTIDDKLYGGVNRGELTIWCAGSGVGKSLFLQNIAVNFAKQGLNVVYISLELSEALCAMRMDSMISEISTKEIFRRLDDVEIKIKTAGRKSGNLHIKQMPQGSTCNDLKVYLKNYEIETGKRCDALIVDYLDLLFPNNKRIDPSNLFVKDKFVTEELRGLMVERKMIGQTAAQLNRGAVQEQEHDHSHISGGISKIQTADNVISIFSSAAMKERGQYQAQFLKTRSSSGVGSKVNLGFDTNTLRIFDMDEDGAAASAQPTSAEIFADLRRRNVAAKDAHASNKTDSAGSTGPGATVTKTLSDLSNLKALIRR